MLVLAGLFVFSQTGSDSNILLRETPDDLLELRRRNRLIKPEKLKKAVEKAFDLVDIQKDGKIKKKNCEKATRIIMASLNIPANTFNQENFDKIFDPADKNKDRQLSKKEMVNLVEKLLDR